MERPEKRLPKKHKSLLLRAALITFAVYIVLSIIQLQVDIGAKRAALNDINTQIAAQQRTNEELEDANADSDMYLEQQAHDRGLAKPGESIYKEAPGSE